MTQCLTAYLAQQTSWSEEYILNMPFFKVLLYVHSFNVINGSNTRWLATSSDVDKIDKTELDSIINGL